MTGEELILHFTDLNGRSVTLDALNNYHAQVQRYIDSIGSGPYVPRLREIQNRVVAVIKDWSANKIVMAENVQVAPIELPVEKVKPDSTIAIKRALGELKTIVKSRPHTRTKVVEKTIVKEAPVKKAVDKVREVKAKKVNAPQRKVVKKKKLSGIGENKSLETNPKQVPPKEVQPPAEPIATGNPKVYSASDLAGLQFKTLELADPYKTDFHKINSDTQIMIWGRPGSGKTVYLLKFAQYFAQKLGLKTLYVANEEIGRSTLSEKINQFHIGDHPNLKFVENISDEPFDTYDAIFLDSVNSTGLSLKDYILLTKKNKGKIFVPIVQSTKDGDFRGGKDWEHAVDIAGEIVNSNGERKLILTKNRLDPDNSKKAEQLLKDDLINEGKKKAEIKQAVKDGLKPTNIIQPITSNEKEAA